MANAENAETDAESGNPNLAAALSYGARGWCIYPSFPGTKSKTNLKWRTASTNSEKQVRQWWTKSPNATICLDCEKSGLAVLDVDQKNGKDGRAGLDWLEVMNGILPPTLKQRTASGGTHLIFKGKIKTTVGADDRALGEGVDTRGNGGMIVLAPTKLANGQYEWLNDLEPADLPQWVADLAGTIPERNEAPDAEFTPTYTQEEFAELLNLIPVEKYDGKHDVWLELLLACTHASTVEDGKEAFMEWTTRDGPGERVGYAADYDKIAARWDSNYAGRNMSGNAVKVGTFNKHLTDAGYDSKVKNPWASTAEEDFSGPDDGSAQPATVWCPQVVLEKGKLPRAARQIKKYLIRDSAGPECPASDRIFRRGEKLVHLNRNELSPEDDVHDKEYHVADELVIRLADSDWLGDRAERCICFMRVNKDGDLVPADVPDKLLRRVEKIITPYDFPHLLGTVETPTLRADHSVLDVLGYDRRSGLYFDPGRAVFPKIEDRPSRAQHHLRPRSRTFPRTIADARGPPRKRNPGAVAKSAVLATLASNAEPSTSPLSVWPLSSCWRSSFQRYGRCSVAQNGSLAYRRAAGNYRTLNKR